MNLQVKTDEGTDVYLDTATQSYHFAIADDYLLIYRCDSLADLMRDDTQEADAEADQNADATDATPVAAYADFTWVKEYKLEGKK